MFTNKTVSTSSRVIIVMSVALGAFFIVGQHHACAEDYTGLESVALLDALGKNNSTPVTPQPRGSYGGMESTALLDAVNKDYRVGNGNAARPRNYGGMESTALLDALNRDAAKNQTRSSPNAYGMIK